MKKILYIAAVAALLAGCKDDDDDDSMNGTSRTFKISIQNVSTSGTLPGVTRIDGSAPISHGVWAVYSSGSPIFSANESADVGTERIAEDGFTTEKTNMLNTMMSSGMHGEFVAPGGPDSAAALFSGETAEFFVTASPGDRLQIQTMFVQSNDWFYAFDNNGLQLFNNNNPIQGDHTGSLVLYDAGTEEDQPPGLGNNQKPAQDPLATNIGPADPVTTIQSAVTRHGSTFTIPATSSVVKVTITPQ
jgi:hypothetical protein